MTVQSLGISPNGKFLAAVLSAGGGLRVWERRSEALTDWKAPSSDKTYGRGDATGLTFDRDGNLFTVAQDGNIRRYRRGQWQVPHAIQATGKKPYSAAIHPDMEKIAVGFTDSTAIGLYNAENLKPLPSAFGSTAGVQEGALAAVAWSASGRELYAGGSLKKEGKHIVRVWAADGSASHDIPGVAEDNILSMIPCSNAVALSSAEPAFGILAASGTRPFWASRITADMRGKLGPDFTVSDDGSQVRFGLNERGLQPVLFNVASNSLIDDLEPAGALKPAAVTGLPVSGAFDSPSPQIGAVAIPLDRNEFSRSLAIFPGGEGFLLGTDYGIRYIRKDGEPLWRRQTSGTVWGVNLAQNGKLLVVALGDGTIRWFRAGDQAELLALFVEPSTKRWIIWNPKGYYAASAGAEDLLGWHFNRNWNQSADFFEVAKFRDTFYRPDIVSQILRVLDEEMAIRKANEVRKRKRADENMRTQQLPVIEISSPVDGDPVSPDAVEVTYILRSPTGLPVSRVTPLIDGQAATFTVIAQPQPAGSDALSGKLRVSLPGGDVRLSLVAQSERGDVSLLPKCSSVHLEEFEKPPYRPQLFALVVGVGHYKPENRPLTKIGDIPFSANDADDLKTFFESQIGADKLFRGGQVEKLTNEQATFSNIRAKLSWLRHAPNDDLGDVSIFYFSGHGRTGERGASLLLPYDFNGDEDLLALTKTEILGIGIRQDSKVIVFIDACHGAGGLDTIDFVNSVQSWETQAIVFASSQRNQNSYGKDRNSYYTKALREALEGTPPTMVVGNMITTTSIQAYLENRVPGLASPDQQIPIAVHTANWSQLPLSVVKRVPQAVQPGRTGRNLQQNHPREKMSGLEPEAYLRSRPDRRASNQRERYLSAMIHRDTRTH